MAGQESSVAVFDVGTAPVRTITVTTYIDGVPTAVNMQVLAIADEAGNVIDDFASYRLQVEQAAELRAIREGIEILACTPLRGKT